MNQEEFRRFVTGRTITGVTFRSGPIWGRPGFKITLNDLVIDSIQLGGAYKVTFEGSGQIDNDFVSVSIVNEAEQGNEG